MERNDISVFTMGFYGERTGTSFNLEKDDLDIDVILTGYSRDSLKMPEVKIDRTIIMIPNTEIAVIYNKFKEESIRENQKEYFEKSGYVAQPYVKIPELGIEIFSTCIICRMDNGEIVNPQEGDFELFEKYLKPLKPYKGTPFVEENTIIENFSKKDFKTGDFIVDAEGLVGLVLKEKECIVLGENGREDFDMYNEDLTYVFSDVPGDIVKVYRCDGPCDFLTYQYGDIVFERNIK